MSTRLAWLTLASSLAVSCGGEVEVAPNQVDPTPSQDVPRQPPPLGEPREERKPIALLTQGRPQGLALDATHVYWADAALGTVMKLTKTGGTAVAIATGQASPSGIAVSEGAVYWTNTGDGTVRKASVAGGSVVTLASDQASPRSLTVAGGNVYFTTEDWLMRVPLSGGEPSALRAANGPDIALGQGGVQGITTDGALVYAAPYQLLWPVHGNCEQPSPLGLCNADWYAGPVMRGGAVDGRSVFTAWADGSGGGSISGSDDTGALWWLASDLDGPEAVSVDDTYVYWASTGTATNGFQDGSLMKVPRAGGSASRIALGQIHPVAIAVDESFVFWTNQGSGDTPGSLMRAPK